MTLPAPGAAGSLGANANIAIDTVAPTVVDYRVLFGSESYSLIGSARLDLPWQITGVEVVFSKPIANGNANSLSGVAATGYSGLGTNTLTWLFNAISIGRIATMLAGSGMNALTDAAGNPLAGGTGFAQNFNILYGDATGDGYVTSADLLAVYRGTSAVYSIFDDLDGNGAVDMNDVQIARLQNGGALPPAASGAAQLADGSLLFGGIYAQTDTNVLPAGTPVTAIALLAHAGATVIDGNAVTLSGGIVDASPSPQTIELPLVLVGGSHELSASGGGLTLAGPIGESGGANSIVVVGPGTVTMSGTNSYTGGTTVLSGTLVVTNASALADGSSLTIGAAWPASSGAPAVASPAPALADSTRAAAAAPSTATVPAAAASFPPATKAFDGSRVDGASRQWIRARAVDAVMARRYPADLPWLSALASSLSPGDQKHKTDSSVAALDAVLAKYGE